MDKAEYLKQLMGVLMDPDALEDEKYPIWVRNIVKHLHETVLKDLVRLLEAEPGDPESAGLVIGASKHIESILEKTSENLPAIDEALMEEINMGDFQVRVDEFEKDCEDLRDFEKETLKDIETATNHEASEFYQGKSQGLKSLQDEEGNWQGTRLNTELLMIMLSRWPIIEKYFKTKREVYRLLLKIYWKRGNPDDKFDFEKAENNPDPSVGSFERVKKMLERIGYNPAKPGRPKKKKH